MEKICIITLLMALAIASSIIILGCASNNKNQSYQGKGNYQNRFGANNLTQEQRQQMIEQRMQSMIAACKEKTEGGACTIQNPRGSKTGTCKTQNETLVCSIEINRSQTPMRDGAPLTN